MKKVLSSVCLFVVACSGLFAVPNMSEYADDPRVGFDSFENGAVVRGIAHTSFEAEPSIIDGKKVYVGFEPASKTMVIFGRGSDIASQFFYCELIDKNGVKQTVIASICNEDCNDWNQEPKCKFSFGIVNVNWKTDLFACFPEDTGKVTMVFKTTIYDPDL